MAKVGCCVLFYIAHWQYAAKGRVLQRPMQSGHCTEMQCWNWLLHVFSSAFV